MAASTIGVVGGGAWGTALANAAANAGRNVVLCLRDAGAADELRRTRINRRYLPGIKLKPAVTVTAEPDDLRQAGIVLLVVPAQTLGPTLDRLGASFAPDAALVICSKGIERGSGRFLSEVAAERRPGAAVAVLSGPSFAEDVARGLPTALTLACADGARAKAIAAALSGPTFRVYHASDVRGVEIGGAIKNVLAIACGIVEGRGLGESAKAALTARGFAELMRFAQAYGGRPETLMGLSGLGDVVLTCGSARSRNFALGQRLGGGASITEATGGKLAEGAFTASVLVELADAKKVEMPIAHAVDAVLAGRSTIDKAIETLLARPLRSEG